MIDFTKEPPVVETSITLPGHASEPHPGLALEAAASIGGRGCGRPGRVDAQRLDAEPQPSCRRPQRSQRPGVAVVAVVLGRVVTVDVAEDVIADGDAHARSAQ